MPKKIIYRPNYISQDEVDAIRTYYDRINDSMKNSRGPQVNIKSKLGWQGCWDRQLHWERHDNPMHDIAQRLRKDFGDFEITESSVRYLSAPFLPHSDVKSLAWIENQKNQRKKEGMIILIALWWDQSYTPGTVIYSSPPNLDEQLYSERLDILPHFADEHREEMRNFSIKEIIKWNSPGDLVAWENFQFHSSCQFGDVVYDREKWMKEFISIETCIN